MTRGSVDWSAPVRALILDIDDTLLDTQQAMRQACCRGAEAAWPRQAPPVWQAVSDVFYEDPEGYFDAYTRGELDFSAMRELRYLRACAEADLGTSGFEDFEAAYQLAFKQSQTVFDDVEDFFGAIEAAGVPVCFVTNSGAEQTDMKLEVSGLFGRGAVVTTDTLGVGKPDRRVFDEACRLMDVNHVDTVCVGDTFSSDVVGGRGAGMRVAWLQRLDRPAPRHAEWGRPVCDEGVRVVGSLREVATLLG
ncbi:HAD-IA family hydrolase [Dermatophilus congolensis]|uniref:HAD-IA family hydrolase n=1 Tax=Dermatophilus congolensis TaxID=1863 RepID=UPI001AAF8DA0|nr:HAD family hydrolase [Dermatophilus congolensis]MBO3151203.1 HAD family hydrolase [Dermatophilus congolensis]MBO3161796.1 HAD family hydrolase [Dermatophilus congolensis]MBO3162486.1 HAD family hydrolase [Dermatophilus congolensis]MBO3176042.1 HAD family hydrolase [Dermatophilus congolensis]